MPGTDELVFSGEMKEGVYRAIYGRRDIRSQFMPEPIPDEVLLRILRAAHHAPSVGFMQPWNFIVIEDAAARREVKESFEKAHAAAKQLFPEPKRAVYGSFKLEGILESPVNVCVTCDRSRFGPVVIGRTCQREMDLYSAVCAVQNLWLAARAEGVGVGWVSIVYPKDLKRILRLPSQVVPIAYLCLGYVTHFPEEPELQKAGWLPRLALKEVVFTERWGDRTGRICQALE
ncbi:MAG: 5,6-dimethylbenzimidazole synthase [Candidatus Omnitrophica bacterium]|nr:5,6-dimethylbenzimidazole synthase [Candidatus Omnitrophota bacterium]